METTPATVPGPPDWSGHPTEVPNEIHKSLSENLAFKKVELSETKTRLEGIASALPSLRADYEAKYASLLDYQNQLYVLESQERDLTGQIASFTDSIGKLTTTLPQMNVVSPAVEPVRPVKPQKLLNTVVDVRAHQTWSRHSTGAAGTNRVYQPGWWVAVRHDPNDH